MRAIILIILILLIIYLHKNLKENFDIKKLDKINYCNDNTNANVFNIVSTNGITINSKEIKDYLLNIVYPIGSFYVQYPDVSSNQMSRAFPDDLAPGNLFGGIWVKQWEKDGVFFRTIGGNHAENRDVESGIQPDAMIDLSGNTSWTQTNYYNQNDSERSGSLGVFKHKKSQFPGNFVEIHTDSGSSNDMGIRNFFDLSAVEKIGSEVRVRNRIIQIWKRTG